MDSGDLEERRNAVVKEILSTEIGFCLIQPPVFFFLSPFFRLFFCFAVLLMLSLVTAM
jgi:hypothetical protein